METKTEKNEIEIDVGEIISLLFSRLWIILFAGILCGILVMIASKFLIAPKYTTTTQVYVLSRQNQEGESLTTADLQTGSQLSKDYIEIIQSRTVLNKVSEQLDLGMSAGQIKSMISVSAPAETRSIYISVTDTDAYRAQQIANKVREVASERICEIMKVEAVNVVDEAYIPTSPTSPDIFQNTMLGAVAGIAIAIVIIVLGFIMDDTIKTPDDVERYLGLSVLGSIPVLDEGKKAKHQRDFAEMQLEDEPVYAEQQENDDYNAEDFDYDDEDDYDEFDDYDDYSYGDDE